MTTLFVNRGRLPQEPSEFRARRYRAPATIAVLTMLLFVAGCGSHKAAAPAQVAPEVATVTIHTERVVLAKEFPGRASARIVAEVRPQVSGLIKERLFEEGADVEAGQTLYRLDDSMYQAALRNAEANLAAARSEALQERATLDASIASIEQRRAIVELARVNRDRFEEMAADGATSLVERDRYTTEATVAEADLRLAEAEADSDRLAVEVAEAGILQAEAGVEAARINVEYSRITAPISGRVGTSNVNVGSLVTAHQSVALTTIQQLDPIYIDVSQSYNELLRLRRGMKKEGIGSDEPLVREVQLTLEDGESYSHQGTLQFRDVTVDRSTGSVLVRMVFPNPEGILLPGMFVRAVIIQGVEPAGICVPQQSIARGSKGEPIALLVDETGKVEQRAVTIDRAIGNQWLISAGLAVGDEIIVEGVQRVRHGSQVRAVPFIEPAPGQSIDGASGLAMKPT